MHSELDQTPELQDYPGHGRSRCLVGLIVGGLLLLCRVALAAEGSAEGGIEDTTVLLEGTDSEGHVASGTGLIMGLAGKVKAAANGPTPPRGAFVWTAGHVVRTPTGELRDIHAFLPTSPDQSIPASIEYIYPDRDLAIVSLPPPSAWTNVDEPLRKWPPLNCYPRAAVSRLDSKAELVALGNDGKKLLWSRFNRFSHADDTTVYMETATERPGFSGGPVFTRPGFELVGIFTRGGGGIVSVTQIADIPKHTVGLTSNRPLEHSCHDYEDFSFESTSMMRLGFGLKQPTSGTDQNPNPMVSVELAGVLDIIHWRHVTIGVPISFGIAGTYLRGPNNSHSFFGEASLDLGLELRIDQSFIDMLWGPGLYQEDGVRHWTQKRARLVLARRFGDATAGLAFGYTHRDNEADIDDLSLITDFSLPSRSLAMPGLPPEPTGSVELDRILRNERSEQGSNFGLVARTASDRSRGRGGVVGGFTTDILHGGTAAAEWASIVMAEAIEVVAGAAEFRGSEGKFVSVAALVGPRVRLGGRTGVSGGIYYYAPLFVWTDRLRLPLVGWSASVGLHHDRFDLSALYRYQQTDEIYKDQPNVSSVGLAFSVMDFPD
jgi:hypothetical protein